MVHRAGGLGISVLVCSCASTPWAEVQAQRARIEATRPTCEGEKDCQVKWETAQLYVVKNVDYRIETATSVLIETWPSSNSALAMTVTKEPLGGGRYRFEARAWCGSPFGCSRPPEEVVLGFNESVAAAAP